MILKKITGHLIMSFHPVNKFSYLKHFKPLVAHVSIDFFLCYSIMKILRYSVENDCDSINFLIWIVGYENLDHGIEHSINGIVGIPV